MQRAVGLFLCTALFLFTHVAHAVTLSAVADVHIQDPVITQSENGTYTLIFTAQNNAVTATDAIFGVRIHASSNESVYAITNDQPISIGPRASATDIVTFTVPPQVGAYTVFATLGSPGGVSLAVRAVDTVTQEVTPSARVTVKGCTYTDSVVACEGENTQAIDAVTYTVLKGGIQGATVVEARAMPKVTAEGFSFALDTELLAPGRYVGIVTFEQKG